MFALSSVFSSDNNIRQRMQRTKKNLPAAAWWLLSRTTKESDSCGNFGVAMANVKKLSPAKSLSILSILFNAFAGYGILYFYSLPLTRIRRATPPFLIHKQESTSFLPRMYYGIEDEEEVRCGGWCQ